jgi:phosphoglycolate phosphatase
MAHFAHVIWDWNGTLVDDVAAAVESFNHLLQARSLPLLDVDGYRQVFDFPVRVCYERVGFDFSTEPFAQACAEFIEHYEVRWRSCSLRAGAREVLTRLSERGVSHSVLSATQCDALRLQAEHHDLHAAIDAWVGLPDIQAHGKVEVGRRWMAEQRLARERVVLVGDTLHDLEVAEELGVRCLLIEGGHQSAERLRARGARVCSDLHAVLAAIVEA